MTVDQSKGWYYRFQDPTDEFYSSGWAGVTNRCGVNGGVQLHHLDHVRNQTFHWTNILIGLTHTGAQRSLTDLQAFGILQEQDLLNLAILQYPQVWTLVFRVLAVALPNSPPKARLDPKLFTGPHP